MYLRRYMFFKGRLQNSLSLVPLSFSSHTPHPSILEPRFNGFSTVIQRQSGQSLPSGRHRLNGLEVILHHTSNMEPLIHNWRHAFKPKILQQIYISEDGKTKHWDCSHLSLILAVKWALETKYSHLRVDIDGELGYTYRWRPYIGKIYNSKLDIYCYQCLNTNDVPDLTALAQDPNCPVEGWIAYLDGFMKTNPSSSGIHKPGAAHL